MTDIFESHARPLLQEPQLLADGFAGSPYNILKRGDRYYAVHQAEGAIDARRLEQGAFAQPVFSGSSWKELVDAMSTGLQIAGLDTPWALTEPEAPAAGPPPIPTDNFVNLAFHGDRTTFLRALVASLGGTSQVTLICPPAAVAPYAGELRRCGINVTTLDIEVSPPLVPGSPGRIIYGEIPANSVQWQRFREWSAAAGGRLETIWGLTLPFATIAALQKVFEYNKPTFEGMAAAYEGSVFDHPVLARLPACVDFRDKTIVEFGPSDGLHTGALVRSGARHITAIEARPENVIKLLAARYAYGWNHVEVVAENFHAVLPERYGRFDIAYAHGVYYHSNSPLLFLDNLTRLSDVIVIGGWCATDDNPRTEWEHWTYGGEYRGKTYVEPTHFLSGVQSESVYLEYASLRQFFLDRGFSCTEISVQHRSKVTGLFVRFVAKRSLIDVPA